MSEKTVKADEMHGIEWTWTLGGSAIKYFIIQATYGKIRKYFRPLQYDAKTGKGVQRKLIDKWVKKIKRDMSKGRYSPTVAYATVEQVHHDRKIIQIHHRKVKFTGDINYPVSLTDSQHRFAAMEEIRAESTKMQWLIDAQPIIVQVNLNTDPVEDFLNYQKGRPTDKTHVLSMKITKGMVEDNKKEIYQNSLKIAECLNDDPKSPFYNNIKLETNGTGLIPLNSIMGENASDLSTSLIAGGRIIQLTKMSVEDITQSIINAYDLLVKNSPNLFEQHKLLCLPAKGQGTKGAATIIIGVGCLAAYAQYLFGHEDFFENDDDVAEFLDCCEEVFERNANNNLSGPSKRQIMGEFARALFKNTSEDICWDGIPKELLTLISTSAYNAKALPKTKNAPRKKKKKVTIEELQQLSQTMDNDEIDTTTFIDEDADEDDGFFDLEKEKLTNSQFEVE